MTAGSDTFSDGIANIYISPDNLRIAYIMINTNPDTNVYIY
jgi:hypothetical protein